ncbi:exo-alpha-sialidase [Tautonia marina]|uniref:exo-alpha-sialidase n=1 Tax=Tautonia marina TaxID=2653855 RepID=UPI00126097CE|nr:exo-alpha-sialidase [Tautonia marina]
MASSIEFLDRRRFLGTGIGLVSSLAAGGAVHLPASGGDGDDRDGGGLIAGIGREVIFPGRRGGTTWFHPRPCMVPAADGPVALMTLQSIGGSDVFGPVHWTTSPDLGRSWNPPDPIPGLGRRDLGDGWEVGVCDVVPEYHAQTNSVLAIGHNVYYEGGVLARPQRRRWPVSVVRSPDGHWSEPRRLEWDDPRGSAIYTCGCSQRVALDDGDVLVPLSFGPEGRTHRSVTTVRCSFDGRDLRIRDVGSELVDTSGRGLLEPSLARLEGRFYLTIRAEDDRGYVSVSDDGLRWEPQRPWCWDDGEPLVMSTTQQHWLPHSDGLFLVYTRRDEANVNVMRWRAPLYVSEVDRDRLRLIRSSERVVLPLLGDGIDDPTHVARMGNFHTVAATPEESWVTVGETLPEDGWRGDTLLARVRWCRPNRLAPT